MHRTTHRLSTSLSPKVGGHSKSILCIRHDTLTDSTQQQHRPSNRRYLNPHLCIVAYYLRNIYQDIYFHYRKPRRDRALYPGAVRLRPRRITIYPGVLVSPHKECNSRDHSHQSLPLLPRQYPDTTFQPESLYILIVDITQPALQRDAQYNSTVYLFAVLDIRFLTPVSISSRITYIYPSYCQ